MNEIELNKIFDNIQFQMLTEQNIGYRNKYSKTLQEKNKFIQLCC